MKILKIATLGLALAAIGNLGVAQAKLKRITIGSNPQGSVYFLLASGFAKTFQKELKIRSTAQPHAGSSVYVPLLDKGEMTMGLVNGMDSGAATRGQKPFTKKMQNLYAIARVWILPYAMMVKADSPIKRIEDLKGKRVVIEVKAVQSLANLNRAILATANVSPKDVIEVDSAGVVQNINLVVEGRADAATVAAGMPAVRKAHATVGVRMLSLGPNNSPELFSKMAPGSRPFVQKALKRYPFIKQDQLIVAFDAYLNAGKAVSADDAYAVAKVLHTKWKDLQKAYGPLRGTAQNKIAPPTVSHAYHPGAIKYYKEIGIWSAANEKANTIALAAAK
ncbi:MAG: TAXI family TRAP transporter solute-binding subunit [Rhodospirillaceae bacterium]|jgi:TRAP transporter TAXI family solute receptor